MCCQGQVLTAPLAMSEFHPDPEGEPGGAVGLECLLGMVRSFPPAPAPPALSAPGSRQESKRQEHITPLIRRFPQGWAAPLLPVEDLDPSHGWGWSQEVTPWLWGHQRGATGWSGSGDSHLPPSLAVGEPGRQRVLVFPGEGVVLALAHESHPGHGHLSHSCVCVSPGSSVSLQEGLAARTAQRCSLFLLLPSLPAPEFSKAAGSFPASLGSVSQDPGFVLGSARLLAVPCVGWLPGHGSSWLPSSSFKRRFGLGFPFLERGAPSVGFLEGHFLLLGLL